MSAKKKCLLLEGKQKNNLEELMVTFLRISVLPLWPEGWMFLNNLKKVYNSMTDASKLINSSRSAISNTSLDRTNVEKSKSDVSNSEKAKLNQSNVDSLNSIAPVHSNLTITPVEVKTSSVNPEVCNSVTVTKISNEGTNTNTSSETTLPSSHLLKKMYDEIAKSQTDEIKSLLQERGKPEKDYTRPKVINLDVPSSKVTSKVNQDSFKSQGERSSTEQKNHWPNEVR